MRITVTVEPDLGEGYEYTATVPAQEPLASSPSDPVAALRREQAAAGAVLGEIAAYAAGQSLPLSPAAAPDVTYRMRLLGGDA
ncbi:hypothetical protein [Actinomyces procaprae]|uniref:hypothetical protein n=1 Tax=Actinomyces procaprae TaxID=2560010 RepID=UPI0010A24CD1|nr:hypothetical protein [Actinomyces procaprae]